MWKKDARGGRGRTHEKERKCRRMEQEKGNKGEGGKWTGEKRKKKKKEEEEQGR